jgi:hypothetical protein
MNIDYCPGCDGFVTVNRDGSRACGFTVDGIEWGCGWSSPPLFDLAPPPDLANGPQPEPPR